MPFQPFFFRSYPLAACSPDHMDESSSSRKVHTTMLTLFYTLEARSLAHSFCFFSISLILKAIYTSQSITKYTKNIFSPFFLSPKPYFSFNSYSGDRNDCIKASSVVLPKSTSAYNTLWHRKTPDVHIEKCFQFIVLLLLVEVFFSILSKAESISHLECRHPFYFINILYLFQRVTSNL